MYNEKNKTPKAILLQKAISKSERVLQIQSNSSLKIYFEYMKQETNHQAVFDQVS